MAWKVTYQALVERWLAGVHWLAAPLCFLLFLLFPAAGFQLVVSLAIVLAVTTGICKWLLDKRAQPNALRLERLLSTAVEWLIALSIVFVYCRRPSGEMVAIGIMSILIAIATARFGLAGLLGGVIAAAASGAVLTVLQVRVLGHLPTQVAFPLLLRWETILLPIRLVTGALLRAMEQAYEQVVGRWADEHLVLQQLRSHLSPRERQLLPLLASTLSNNEIAGQLNVSPETIKVHVRRIGEKLGAPGRRQAVVAAARHLRLLDS